MRELVLGGVDPKAAKIVRFDMHAIRAEQEAKAIRFEIQPVAGGRAYRVKVWPSGKGWESTIWPLSTETPLLSLPVKLDRKTAQAVVDAYVQGRVAGYQEGRTHLQEEFRDLFGIPSHADTKTPLFG